MSSKLENIVPIPEAYAVTNCGDCPFYYDSKNSCRYYNMKRHPWITNKDRGVKFDYEKPSVPENCPLRVGPVMLYLRGEPK